MEPSKPVIYTTLFAQDAQSPYIAMSVLLVASLRRVSADVPCVVFDYSHNQEVAQRLASWQDELRFEIRPLRYEALLRRFEPRHAWCLRYDAPLRIAPNDLLGNIFIHFDADTLCVRDPVELAAGEFDYRLPVIAADPFKVGDWLAIFDLRKDRARRVLALALALNQEPHVWQPFDSLSSRRHNYPASDSCMEVAVQLLGHRGLCALGATESARYLMHYARHETQIYPSALETATNLLQSAALLARFEIEFGPLRPLIYRENSGYERRTTVVAGARAERLVYVDDIASTVPLGVAESTIDRFAIRVSSGSPVELHGNETARLLWRLADGHTTIGDISSQLAGALAAPFDTVFQDAWNFYLELWRDGRVCFAPRVSLGMPTQPKDLDLPMLVVIFGLHGSGINQLAGALAALGVIFEVATDGAGNSEFSRICRSALPEPLYNRTTSPTALVWDFSRCFESLHRQRHDASHIGAAHPGALALSAEIDAAYPGPIRYIHLERPLHRSIASATAEYESRAPGFDPVALHRHQVALWEWKQVILASHPNLTIDYCHVSTNPGANIARLIDYLDLVPTESQVTEALAILQS